jgi:hypothetical protein
VFSSVGQKASGGSQQRLAELCSVFYTYIPHNFGRKAAPLLTLADIQVCDVLKKTECCF